MTRLTGVSFASADAAAHEPFGSFEVDVPLPPWPSGSVGPVDDAFDPAFGSTYVLWSPSEPQAAAPRITEARTKKGSTVFMAFAALALQTWIPARAWESSTKDGRFSDLR